jgi:cyclic pyranopterin phosphate synthase
MGADTNAGARSRKFLTAFKKWLEGTHRKVKRSRRPVCARARVAPMSNSSPADFSHLDATGAARMVDVGHKPAQQRIARAEGVVRCQPETISALRERALPKGDVLTVAKIAAIQAAKRTDELIPLCHSLPIDSVDVEFAVENDAIRIRSSVSTTAKTGVEMEALTAVSVAALTIYDMCKAVDKQMVIEGIRVTEKVKR